MTNTDDTLPSAGITPPSSLVQRFSSYFPPGTPFSYILVRLGEISQFNPRYHICAQRDTIEIADAIHSVKGLTIDDRIVLTSAPCPMRVPELVRLIKELAICIDEQRGGKLLEIRNLNLELLEEDVDEQRSDFANSKYLTKLETLHKGIILYLWLSYRFPGIFMSRPLATHVKEMVESNIEFTLKRLSFSGKKRKEFREKQRTKALLNNPRRMGLVEGEEESEDTVAENMSDGKGGDEELSEAFEARAIRDNEPEETSDMLRDAEAVGGEQEIRDDEGEYPEEGEVESEDAAPSQASYEGPSDETPLGLNEGSETAEGELDHDSSRVSTAPASSFSAWRGKETKILSTEQQKADSSEELRPDTETEADAAHRAEAEKASATT